MDSSKLGTTDEVSKEERSATKALQQKLEQLVSVHRQLLGKYSAVELQVGEYKNKIQLKDERIKRLEDNANEQNRQNQLQNERHIAELTNLREQIQFLRADNHARQQQEQESSIFTRFTQSPQRRPSHGKSFVKSVRGGKRSSLSIESINDSISNSFNSLFSNNNSTGNSMPSFTSSFSSNNSTSNEVSSPSTNISKSILNFFK